MGKGDIKQKRMYMALASTNPNNPHVKLGAIIFKIPITDDRQAQIQIMATQVFDWLVFLTEKMQKYQLAINMVQNWLQHFIGKDLQKKQWVLVAAEFGGARFLEHVNVSKKANGKNNIVKLDINEIFKNAFGGPGESIPK